MNKLGFLSILMVIASMISFLIIRGPNANLVMAIIILGTLSLFGIVFALLSKKWLSGIAGVLLNGVVLVFVFFLVLAWGIAG
jgi:predicted membrane channel-forming protein YqfA (hemolysin III family)